MFTVLMMYLRTLRTHLAPQSFNLLWCARRVISYYESSLLSYCGVPAQTPALFRHIYTRTRDARGGDISRSEIVTERGPARAVDFAV